MNGNGELISVLESPQHPARFTLSFGPGDAAVVTLYRRSDLTDHERAGLLVFLRKDLPAKLNEFWSVCSDKEELPAPPGNRFMSADLVAALMRVATNAACSVMTGMTGMPLHHHSVRASKSRTAGFSYRYIIEVLPKYKKRRAPRPLAPDRGKAMKIARNDSWELQRTDEKAPSLAGLPRDVVMGHILPRMIMTEWSADVLSSTAFVGHGGPREKTIPSQIAKLARVCRAFRAQLLIWPSSRAVMGLSGKGGTNKKLEVWKMWKKTQMPGNFTCCVCLQTVGLVHRVDVLGYMNGSLHPVHTSCDEKGSDRRWQFLSADYSQCGVWELHREIVCIDKHNTRLPATARTFVTPPKTIGLVVKSHRGGPGQDNLAVLDFLEAAAPLVFGTC